MYYVFVFFSPDRLFRQCPCAFTPFIVLLPITLFRYPTTVCCQVNGEIAYFLRERAKAHLRARLAGSRSVDW